MAPRTGLPTRISPFLRNGESCLVLLPTVSWLLKHQRQWLSMKRSSWPRPTATTALDEAEGVLGGNLSVGDPTRETEAVEANAVTLIIEKLSEDHNHSQQNKPRKPPWPICFWSRSFFCNAPNFRCHMNRQAVLTNLHALG